MSCTNNQGFPHALYRNGKKEPLAQWEPPLTLVMRARLQAVYPSRTARTFCARLCLVKGLLSSAASSAAACNLANALLRIDIHQIVRLGLRVAYAMR